MALTEDEQQEFQQLSAMMPSQMPPSLTLEDVVNDSKQLGTARIVHFYSPGKTPSDAKGLRGRIARYLELKRKAEGDGKA